MRMANAIDTLAKTAGGMRDSFGRRIDYLRISVTDRCDLRCRYCMDEIMQFLPKREILTLEEIAIIAQRFIARGVKRIRLSGGEPLVRRDFADLAYALGRHVKSGALDELTLTTNGTQLRKHAEMLVDAGMRRINVSLDALDPAIFSHVTRGGDVAQVLDGLEAARDAGLKVKLNTVALRGVNEDQVLPLLARFRGSGHIVRFIEYMDVGTCNGWRRGDIVDTAQLRDRIAARWPRAWRRYGRGAPIDTANCAAAHRHAAAGTWKCILSAANRFLPRPCHASRHPRLPTSMRPAVRRWSMCRPNR